MIYHDLRSPLANIVSSLDVLSYMHGPGERDLDTVESILTIAGHSTDRIQRLVSSLLDINRLESGQADGRSQGSRPAGRLIQKPSEDVKPDGGEPASDPDYPVCPNSCRRSGWMRT